MWVMEHQREGVGTFDVYGQRAPKMHSSLSISGACTSSARAYNARTLLYPFMVDTWIDKGEETRTGKGKRERRDRSAKEPNATRGASLLFIPCALKDGFPPLTSTLSFSPPLPRPPPPTDDAFRSRFLWARKPMLAAAAARLCCGGSLPPPRSLVW